MAAGIYLHIPFCRSRCSYCDFATDVYRNADGVERYVDALCREIQMFSPPTSGESYPNIDTIYFGGGTPSLLTPEQEERILTAVHSRFTVSADAEITMEMNPGTVTPANLAAFRSIGVNRASFGVQTFNDRALKVLARGHDADDARQTFRLLRESGFGNISFDLIAGLPGQTFADWERNLAEAVKLQPEHMSLYLLEIHEGTPLAEQVRSGRQPLPDEDLAADMYEYMIDTLTANGYQQYEISNFAKPGFESRHNNKYWRLDPVYGFGVSAHSFDGIYRYANERDTALYICSVATSGSAEATREEVNAQSEYVFLGLRLNAGVDLGSYERRFGRSLISEYGPSIARLTDANLIYIDDRTIRLSRKGMLFSNDVFAEFV